ncbi:MAG TPA: ATP-binding protein [Acidimicrobiia bacterium]|nr:ATP-binding protein [Acidimicrobiia bacterium]
MIRVEIAGDVDVIQARQAGRALASDLGFCSSDLVVVPTAISELARNILRYAGRGEITIEAVRGRRTGIKVVATDSGPGIADIALALQDGYSSSGSLGLGLPGVRRLADEFAIRSERGEGTVVQMIKWL